MRRQAWFEVGEKYPVFARGNQTGGKLWIARCSRTKSFAAASEHLQQFGKGNFSVKKLFWRKDL